MGPSSEPIARDDYRRASQPEFYNGSNPQYPLLEVSQIETAIRPPERQDAPTSHENDNQLVAIITDLYQKEADLNKIVGEIKSHFLNSEKPENAVGILAVKSNFNGKIYDIGLNEAQLSWNGTHPFYVLFLGSYPEIHKYFNQLEERLQDIQEKHFVIFSPRYLVDRSSELQNALPDLPEGLERPTALQYQRVVVELTPPYDLLEIEPNFQESLTLKYRLPFAAPDYILPIDPASLTLSPSLKRFESTGKLQERGELNPIAIGQPTISEGQLNFSKTIDPVEFEEPGIYAVTIDLLASQLKEQKWWNEWSSDENSTDGSKTHNLSNFLNTLKAETESLMAKPNPREVGRFCYAIQKN